MKNSLIKASTSYHSYLKMAGLYNGSISKYELTNDMFFQWAQLKHTIRTRWKTLISNYSDTDQENLCQNHVI